MRFQFIVFAGLFAATPLLAQQKSVLTVMTYDSFVTEWGPGPAIEASFEETCNCDLRFVAAGDGAALLARIRLEGERSDADIVLGLDTNLTATAVDTGLFAPHGIDVSNLDLPVSWEDEVFLPYDWGYFAFVHEAGLEGIPANLRALGDSDISIVIQDPRSSTPGLGLLLWVKHAYGDEAEKIWEALADNIVTVTPGWSEAYGLFLEGEADMALSYTTSPAYHLIAEDDAGKVAASFDEGHYMQIEVAGRLNSSDQPELASDFLRFMLTDAFQSVIPTTNWMYPVKIPEGGLPQGFETLVQPSKALIFAPEKAAAVRELALEEWLNALSR